MLLDLLGILGRPYPSVHNTSIGPSSYTFYLPHYLYYALSRYKNSYSIFPSHSRVNFFAGIIVSSVTYWALNRLFPVPLMSATWREVGEDITDISLVYNEHDHDDDYDRSPDVGDEESVSVKESGKFGGRIM